MHLVQVILTTNLFLLRIFWLGSATGNIIWEPTVQNFTKTLEPSYNQLHVPNSNAYVNLKDDKGPANLFVTAKNESHKIIFETWKVGISY